MKRVILIGGSGFLGSHLLQLLQKENTEILLITNKTSFEKTDRFQILEGGISAINTSLINSFKPDIIFHCARPTLPRFKKWGRKIAARKAFKLNNKLIKNMQGSDYKPKLVFASGSLMYGNSKLPHDELSPLMPISYAKQYIKGELPIIDAVRQNDFPVIVLRFPWLLGNGSWFKWFYVNNIMKHKSIPKIGKMENLMEIIDVKDAAKLMWLYAESISASGIFNIPSQKPVSQASFNKYVEDAFSVTGKDYTLLYPKDPEKEALEAFRSNIVLTSLFSDLLGSYEFSRIKDTLSRIKKENKLD